MNIDEIVRSMTNITPNEEQIKRIELIRKSFKDLIRFVDLHTVDSRYKSIAVTNLETSLMYFVKSIVLEADKAEKSKYLKEND